MNKTCVCALTRGYYHLQQYKTLILRNQYIDRELKNKNTDIVLFHEGNIPFEHQQFIKNCTPFLKLIFINVNEGKAFRKEKESIAHDPETSFFGHGYRHMCSFWFVDFWSFVEDYDVVLRIDEDCLINFTIDDVFDSLISNTIVTGAMEIDCEHVTKGLNQFTLDFLGGGEPRVSEGPYTNMIGFNLEKLRANEKLHEYIHAVDKSNKIYSQRWGDLPLWGEAVHYIIGSDNIKIGGLPYYHGSHGRRVS